MMFMPTLNVNLESIPGFYGYAPRYFPPVKRHMKLTLLENHIVVLRTQITQLSDEVEN